MHPDDLREYVHRRGLNYLEDPTNEDLDRARNRIRYRILPEWETVQPDPESAIYGLGERMKRENNFWEHYLSDRFEESIYPGEIQVNRETFQTAHSAAQFRYLHHLVTKVLEAGQGMSTKNYEDLRNLFTEGRSGAWLSLPDPLYALNEYDRGSISTRLPPELIELQSMDPSLEVSFGEEGVLRVDDERELLRGPRRTYYSRISENSVEEGTIRTWEEGDCFQRDGALSKLTEFFDDWKIPYRARRCWPLLAVEGTIVAVPGFFHEQNLQSDSLYFGFSSEHPLFELVGSKGPRSEPPNIL